jgi:hypothetical protein
LTEALKGQAWPLSDVRPRLFFHSNLELLLPPSGLVQGDNVVGIIAQAAVFYGFQEVNLAYGVACLKVGYGPGAAQDAVAGPAGKAQVFDGPGKETAALFVKAAKPVYQGRRHTGISPYGGVFIANLLNFHRPAHPEGDNFAAFPRRGGEQGALGHYGDPDFDTVEQGGPYFAPMTVNFVGGTEAAGTPGVF